LRELITARSQRLKTARLSWVRALLHGRQMPALAHVDMQEGEMIRGMLRDSFIRILSRIPCRRSFTLREYLYIAKILNVLKDHVLNIHYMGFKVDLPEWVFSSEREDLSVEFMRFLAAAQEGGSSLAECWATASRIDFSDDNSWHREWKKIADTNNEQGNDALCKRNMLTARSNWLRAVNYYQAAAFPYDQASQNHLIAECMRECAGKYLGHRNPAGEVVLIP